MDSELLDDVVISGGALSKSNCGVYFVTYVNAVRLLWMLFLLFLSALAWAETRLVVVNVPPFGYLENNHVTGAVSDLLLEAARRIGHSGRIELMPLARVLAVTKSDPNVLASLPRMPANEPDFRWLAEVAVVPFVLMAAKDSSVNISTVNAARKLRVGVLNASPAEQLARAHGFTKIEAASSPDANARKLARGRIDAWLVPLPEGSMVQQRAGLPIDGLRIGAKVDVLRGYLAVNPKFDAEEASRWSAAIAEMKKDGSCEKILRHYQLEPVP